MKSISIKEIITVVENKRKETTDILNDILNIQESESQNLLNQMLQTSDSKNCIICRSVHKTAPYTKNSALESDILESFNTVKSALDLLRQIDTRKWCAGELYKSSTAQRCAVGHYNEHMYGDPEKIPENSSVLTKSVHNLSVYILQNSGIRLPDYMFETINIYDINDETISEYLSNSGTGLSKEVLYDLLFSHRPDYAPVRGVKGRVITALNTLLVKSCPVSAENPLHSH